ncbi:hypothetical protein PG994_000669 [Apiospora phragmitis]|uniref:Uncharacterized protein n=1 Tax=Apiospora phragmitis TaxID=2905665 RepID=A0ABR1X6X2_9PEZI
MSGVDVGICTVTAPLVYDADLICPRVVDDDTLAIAATRQRRVPGPHVRTVFGPVVFALGAVVQRILPPLDVVLDQEVGELAALEQALVQVARMDGHEPADVVGPGLNVARLEEAHLDKGLVDDKQEVGHPV